MFGIAYNRVKDFAGNLSISGYNDYLRGFQTGEAAEEGGMGIISVGGAVDVSPNVSVGASFDIWLGDYKRDNRSLLNDDSAPYSQLDFTGADDDISAWSFKPSILYFTEKYRVGAYARLPMTFHIDERYYSEGYSRDDGGYFNLYEMIDPSSPFADDVATYTENLDYTIKAPMQLGFGMSFGKPGDCAGLDIVYENWTQAKIDYPSYYIAEPNYFRDKYRSSMSWRVGGEKTIPRLGITGRIGYMRLPILFKGPRGYDPSNPTITVSNERDFITLGIGKQFDPSLTVDVAYIHGFSSWKETPRKDDETIDRLYIAMTYHLPVPGR